MIAEYMGFHEKTILILFSLIIPLFVLAGIWFYEKHKKANQGIQKIIIFRRYMTMYLALSCICMAFVMLFGHLFFKTEARLQEVEHAKLQAVAQEFHVYQKEVKLQEKNIPDLYYRSAKRVYEAKVKGETFEIVLDHDEFKKYWVVKISKVLKEER